jgi:hypothetical protein
MSAEFLKDPERYHDLVDHYSKAEAYHDFEGLADAWAVLQRCKDKDGKYIWDTESKKNPNFEITRSLLLAFLYERADSFGVDDLKYNNIIDMWEMLGSLLNCRWWSRVTDEQIKAIEESISTEE